jgi:flavin-dependent thymidylate synthase
MGREYTASRDWADQRETALLRDVAFNRHSMQDGKHVSPYDNAQLKIGDDGIAVNLVQGLNPEFQKVLSKAQRATIGIDLALPDEDNRDWLEMLEGGLQTALESQVIVFEVSGISRTCTHQLVRTRKAAHHQQSQRASFFGNHPEMRIPESIWRLPDDVRRLWIEAVMAAHKAYQAACDADASYQDARFVLPEGTTTYTVFEISLREFINVYAYRGCNLMQWEIVSLFRMMREILIKKYEWLEPYIKITCEQTRGAIDRPYDENDPSTHHTCRWQGWESVEHQCNFPWARESNRSFKSKHHSIERAKS